MSRARRNGRRRHRRAASSRGADTLPRGLVARLQSTALKAMPGRCAARDAAYAPLAYTDLALDDLTS